MSHLHKVLFAIQVSTLSSMIHILTYVWVTEYRLCACAYVSMRLCTNIFRSWILEYNHMWLYTCLFVIRMRVCPCLFSFHIVSHDRYVSSYLVVSLKMNVCDTVSLFRYSSIKVLYICHPSNVYTKYYTLDF